MSIKIRSICKSFETFDVLKDVNLEIESGELMALLGPSGSGKTSLLRMLAGLDVADSGDIYFDDQNMVDVPVRERQVGFVFQHYALFPHMTVFENIAFGLRVKPRKLRMSSEKINQKVMELLGLVQLENLASRHPWQLSGGQRQRVALARALAISPRVLLLDEPFGALDAKVRKELRQWLRQLHEELRMTTVFVTHDVEEALEVADRVAVMQNGKLEQVGTPSDVYHHPSSAFVYRFMGQVNVFASRQGLYVRPHLLEIHAEMPVGESFSAKIDQIYDLGSVVRVDLLTLEGDCVQAELTYDRYKALGLKKADLVYITIKESKSFVGDYSI